MKCDTSAPESPEPLERPIARLLGYGTWLASATIAVGLLLVPVQGRLGLSIAKAGVGLFILLPVTRVGLMVAIFLRGRDYAYAAIGTLVLAVIAAGFLAAV